MVLRRFSFRCSSLFILTLLVLSASVAVPPGLRAAERPNVLLIAIDDLNDWVGCLGGHPDARTVNIDRLAERGVLFTNAHCQAPICNPSRTSFLLGLRPSTTGIYYNSPFFRTTERNKDRVTLPQHFAGQGYHTLTTGKIFHGSFMDDVSFDVIGPRPGQRSRLDARVRRDMPRGTVALWDFGPQTYAEEKFNDYADASWAIEQLKAEQERPFFLAVGFYRPHVPLYAPQRLFDAIPRATVKLPKVKDDDRDDLPETAIRVTTNNTPPPHSWFVEHDAWRDAVQAYLACIRFTDEQVGRLLDALDNSPHKDNTIVVLFSDHGFHLGEKQRWAKQSLWERSTHVPLIVCVPDGLKGARCSRPVELLSIFPTLIELCGVEGRPDLEGVSIAPLLKNPEAKWERPAITNYGRNNHSVRSERWRYIRYLDGAEELYDHSRDPNEWNNLAGDAQYAEVIREHAKWLPTVNVEEAKRERRK